MPNPNYLNLATMQGQVLCSQQISTTAATTAYVVPASTTVRVTHGVLCNVSASPVTVSLAIVPSGGSADGTHRIISGYNLAAGDSLPLRDYLAGAMLGPGDFISVQMSTANAVDVVITGAVST